MKKQLIAAAVAALCPLILLGLVGGYEAELLPFWGMIALGAVCLYGEWWGLSTIDGEEGDT